MNTPVTIQAKVGGKGDGTGSVSSDRAGEPAIKPGTKTLAKDGQETLRFPAAPGQRRFWVLHQLDPHSRLLNLAVRWRVEGVLDNSVLEQAFRHIIARHSVLRTSFAETNGELIQIVEPHHISFQIPIIDLAKLSEMEALSEVERIAGVEASTPFELVAPPLMRVMHVGLRPGVSILLVTLHHIISDHWSVAILAHQVSEIYEALSTGQPAALSNLPLSYGEFAEWHARQLSHPDRASDAQYWKRSLHGLKHFEIQPDHRRPPVLTANGGMLAYPLDQELANSLISLAQKYDTTLHVTVLAALLTLLHRYTGETDIAIGGEFAGRGGAGLDGLLGLFSKVLLVRCDLSGGPSFLALLANVRDHIDEILKHQHVTHENLMEIAKPQPDLSRNQLFSVNFMFERPPAVKHFGASFKLEQLQSGSVGAKCDLDFSIMKGLEDWEICCEFNADLFEAKTINGVLGQLHTLLRAVVDDPTRTISGLSILKEAERRVLVEENNRTSLDYPEHLTVPHLFQAQAQRTPDAVAVVCGERSLTYRELDIASTWLAHDLQARAIEPGSRIAVFMDRTPELMVAFLAVLKTGSAYIPLDPAYPTERLQYVLENARPAAVITRASLLERVANESMAVVVVDSSPSMCAQHCAEPMAPLSAPNDPAYIIYTSGSTGRPKGVVVHHRALLNLVCALRRQPGLTDRDSVVSVTTVSFDMSVLELYLPLIVGARLIFATEHEMADGRALVNLLVRHRATFMQATPVMWQILLESGWRGEPPLKMLCGGEAMPRNLAETLVKCGGELWNMYGPTETTVWSSALRVESGEGPVPLGPPIANTQFYLLDSQQELVPHGVPGELFIGGDGVALGYFGQPELSAERFLPDKFRKLPGAKMYRTGDIMRLTQNGQMEYLGRSDHQVKLRGFRIELGEIDAALLRYPGIKEAVSVLGKDTSGESAIWAYVISQGPAAQWSEAQTGALRRSLAQFLPNYMCPSSIVVLDAFPRTPNGKIDRLSLPAPLPAKPESNEPALPLNEIERRLANLWSSVLGIQTVDKTGDFFEMGGQSLLAARLLARIEVEFGQRLSLLTLFKAPSIEKQAKLLMNSVQREFDFRQVVRLHPNGSKPPLIALHNTGVYYYNLSKRLGPDQPLTALQLFDPSIARKGFPQSFEEIAAEYVELILKLQPAGPYKLIGWCVAGVLAFEVGRQLVRAGHEVSQLAMIDAWAPGHNKRLPWLRAVLSDYSYRWRLIGADWQRVVSREQSFASFLAQRVLYKRVRRWLGRADDGNPREAFPTGELSAKDYEQRLFSYIVAKSEAYEPKLYPGKVTLLCNAQEPRGLFLDPQMGWGPFASGGLDSTVIEGNHFTIFNGAGLEQMARHLASVTDVYGCQRRVINA